MASGDTRTNQYLDIAANGTRADLPAETCCETRTQTLIRGVAERIMDVEDEVEEIKNNPDVADIVATYADLQNYDTSHLTDNDVIRVLADETHDGDSTYYRWSTTTQTFTYIGESKQYTDFVGTDGTAAGVAGLVPAPATTDAGKFLKADGTWATAGGGGSYTAGNGIDITADVISVDTTTIQPKLTAGTNVSISAQNEISATDTTYTAGTNVQISSGNVISATDTTYSAGSGLNLTGTAFSVDTTTIQPKLTAGSNVTIDANNEISATDTTYSNFVGTDGTAAGTAGLVPAPATTDAGKFLKADGTWDTAGGGGNSAVTILTASDYDYPTSNPTSIAIWALQDGLYYVADGVNWSFPSKIFPTSPVSTTTVDKEAFFQVEHDGGLARVFFISAGLLGQSNGEGEYLARGYSITYNGTTLVPGSYSIYSAITTADLQDSLSSTSTIRALTANQGKVLRDRIDGRVATNAGAPTTATVGTVGQLLEDTTNGKLYICTDATDPYVWTEVGAGGGGPTVVQTTGTSTTDVMSQNAVTSMVFADPSTMSKIKIGADTSSLIGSYGVEIGYASKAATQNSIAIGQNAATTGSTQDSIAIGQGTQAYGRGSVALGAGARIPTGKRGCVAIGEDGGYSITDAGTVDISTRTTASGYNSSNYRLLTGLYDPQSAHDAATKGYVDTAVAGAAYDPTISNNTLYL